MEERFVVVIAESKISETLRKDLLKLGFSKCSIIPSIDSPYTDLFSNQPDLVIVEFDEKGENSFLDFRESIQKQFNSPPILFLTDEKTANKFIEKGNLKRNGYITKSYSFRELELCVEAVLSQFVELKSSNILFDRTRFISFFNILPNGVIICDDVGKILNANKALTKILGYSSEEFNSLHIKNLVPEDSYESIKNNIDRVLRGETIRSEVVNICKNGERKNLELIETKIVLPSGKDGIVIISSDITHWKEVNNALKESEEKYKILVEKSNDGIIFVQDGILVYGNPRIMKMTGVSSDEFIGQPFIKFLHACEIDKVMEKYQKRQVGETPEIYETFIKGVNDVAIPVEFNVNMAFYQGKKATMVFIRDISDRKNAEAVLVESEEKYRTLTEQIPVGIYRTSESGKIFYANPALAQILGFETVEELVAHNVNEFYINNDERFEAIDLIRNSDGYTQGEFRLVRNDGKLIWVRDNGKATFDSQGNLLFFDGVIENITEQKEANEALKESESNLKVMLNAIPDLIFRINSEGVYVGFYSEHNDKQKTPLERIIGASLRDFFPKDVSERIHSSIKKCLESNSFQTIEYQMEEGDEVQFYEARIVAASSDEVICLARNITKRKKDEKKITMLAQTIMNIKECISITDTNNQIIYVNPAFLQTYGYSEEEILGKNMSLLKPPSISEEMSSLIHEGTLRGSWQGELLNIRKDGSEFPISLSTAIVQDENDQPVAFVGVANDITDRRIAERDLIRAKEKAEESDRLKTAFLANMSHEIRSPMNAILGFIRLIKEEEKLSENGKQYIDLISNSGTQLVSVIEDILDTSKIQANQLRLSIHEFDLNALLIDLYTIYSAQVKEKYKMSTIMLPPILPYPSPFLINSDDMRIKQILNNLLSNAIKFTSKGLIEFGYSVFVDDENPLIQFYVKDTGIGLAPDALNLIFERFRQADDSYTRMYGGSGLGLAISKGLIELLGGKIWVESQEGKGSTFYFTLPFVNMINQNKDRLMIEDVDVKELSLRLEGLNWAGKTILIIEDIQDVQYFLKKILDRTSVNLLFASSLKEAREVFQRSRRLDLILLDIRLPDGDGYELAIEFKSKNSRIPIIAQTAYAMQGEKEKSISFGCDDFITKPINPDLLFLKIDNLLKKGI